MTLQDQIDHDLKEAMKAREADRLAVLRMLKSAAKYAAIEKYGADGKLEDSDAVAVVRKELKKRQDAIEGYEKGGRADLVAKEKTEIEFLNAYLPKQLSADEVVALVKEAIAEAGATSKAQMGAVMKAAQAKAAGRADGKTLSAEVGRQLG
jgi:uncharacterized protein